LAPAADAVAYPVYAAAIADLYSVFRHGQPPVLDPLTTGLSSDRLKYIGQTSVPREFGAAFSDFLLVNRTRVHIASSPLLPAGVTVGATVAPYNGARACLAGEVSQVGFSPDSTRAVVYAGVDCSYDTGIGELYLLLRESTGRWVISGRRDVWSM